MRELFRVAWAGWKALAHRIANVQARVLLSVFYFVILGPFALGMKLLADPLALRSAQAAGWSRRDVREGDPGILGRRQF